MKKIYLLTALIFNFIAFSQIKSIELIKCEKIGIISQGAFSIKNEKCSDGNYKFTFRDFNYQKIDVLEEFKFKDIDGAYDSLFNAIINAFETKEKNGQAFELPNEIIQLKYMSSLGMKGVAIAMRKKIINSESQSNYFFKSQYYKLFGKEKEK